MAPVFVALTWIVVGPIAAFFITGLASRLLGVRRGWLSMAVAGAIGWTVAVVVAGLLTSWTWSSWQMVLAAVAFGPVLTMVAAVGLDLLALPGTLTRGDRSGLLTVPRPFRTVRQAVAPVGRYSRGGPHRRRQRAAAEAAAGSPHRGQRGCRAPHAGAGAAACS